MRILFISNSKANEYRIRSELAMLCEGTSLQFCYDFKEARSFIDDEIVKKQMSIDLIIAHSLVASHRPDEFKNYIRLDFKNTYSKRDFKLCEVPIVILTKNDENKSSFHEYNMVLETPPNEELHVLIGDLVQVIKEWRRGVLADLDSLGITLNSGIINYDHFFRERNLRNRTTRILSDNFRLFPRKLNYYWLDYNKEQIERSIDQFIKMLKRSSLIGAGREEKKYHHFFNENESFLLRDSYSKFWYEAKLMKNKTEYEEPDYTLRPNMMYQTDLSLLEVKLPNEAFMTRKKYHRPLRASLMQHIFQVNDYKDYLESDQYLSAINEVFGYVPKRINYNLLIGRTGDREENLYELKKRMRQAGQGDLNLITYDDLMEYQVRFLDRMELINIKN